MASKPTPIISDVDALFRRGVEALEYERFEEAAALLKQAVNLAPDWPEAFLGLGIARTRLLQIPEAIEALETAIRLAPLNFYPHFRLAQLYLRVGVPTKAKQEIDRALEVSENSEQRRLARELRAIDARQGAKRIWRPDFSLFSKLRKRDR
jgi:tetratricopeptide (TPR) repeat protein